MEHEEKKYAQVCNNDWEDAEIAEFERTKCESDLIEKNKNCECCNKKVNSKIKEEYNLNEIKKDLNIAKQIEKDILNNSINKVFELTINKFNDLTINKDLKINTENIKSNDNIKTNENKISNEDKIIIEEVSSPVTQKGRFFVTEHFHSGDNLIIENKVSSLLKSPDGNIIDQVVAISAPPKDEDWFEKKLIKIIDLQNKQMDILFDMIKNISGEEKLFQREFSKAASDTYELIEKIKKNYRKKSN